MAGVLIPFWRRRLSRTCAANCRFLSDLSVQKNPVRAKITHIGQESINDEDMVRLACFVRIGSNTICLSGFFRSICLKSEGFKELLQCLSACCVGIDDKTPFSNEVRVLSWTVQIKFGRFCVPRDQLKRKRGSFARLRLQSDVATHECRKIARDCKAEARSSELLRGRHAFGL